MRLIIVRHGDPDYAMDSLTETGWKEAGLAAQRIAGLDINHIYVSPLGRARDTAACTVAKMLEDRGLDEGKKLAEDRENVRDLLVSRPGMPPITTCEWLREFAPRIHRPDVPEREIIAWDWLPQDWTTEPKYYNVETWTDTRIMQEGGVGKEYEWVCSSLDALLREHGYVREGNYYRVERANEDTLVFFCHFGLECVLISHLAHVSPMILWHNFCAAPTSVTTIYTEERREGIASFRVNGFGDVSHLYAAGQQPSFSARFCECYKNADERHD